MSISSLSALSHSRRGLPIYSPSAVRTDAPCTRWPFRPACNVVIASPMNAIVTGSLGGCCILFPTYASSRFSLLAGRCTVPQAPDVPQTVHLCHSAGCALPFCTCISGRPCTGARPGPTVARVLRLQYGLAGRLPAVTDLLSLTYAEDSVALTPFTIGARAQRNASRMKRMVARAELPRLNVVTTDRL